MDTWVIILGYLIAPVSSVISYFAGRKKANNDFLQNMQASINLLADENKKLMAEVVALRKENTRLRIEIEELNEKLSNIKTITKTK
jgi:regulator of replication initiation timing